VGRVQLLQIYVPWSTANHLIGPLAALTALNEQYLREHPNTPKLYESGVRYSREGKYRLGRQKEKWLTVPLVLILKRADCEDLACFRASEHRVAGVAAVAVPVESSIGYHIVVRMPNGTIEDPSRVLGMGANKDG
jgi:hypothetical protein